MRLIERSEEAKMSEKTERAIEKKISNASNTSRTTEEPKRRTRVNFHSVEELSRSDAKETDEEHMYRSMVVSMEWMMSQLTDVCGRGGEGNTTDDGEMLSVKASDDGNDDDDDDDDDTDDDDTDDDVHMTDEDDSKWGMHLLSDSMNQIDVRDRFGDRDQSDDQDRRNDRDKFGYRDQSGDRDRRNDRDKFGDRDKSGDRDRRNDRDKFGDRDQEW